MKKYGKTRWFDHDETNRMAYQYFHKMLEETGGT